MALFFYVIKPIVPEPIYKIGIIILAVEIIVPITVKILNLYEKYDKK